MIYEMMTDRPQTAKELAERLHCDTRRVTEAIQQERRDGFPILADGAGYYVSDELTQLSMYVKRLKRQMGELAKTYRAIRKIEKNWNGRLPLI